jgi:hypothetical protein
MAPAVGPAGAIGPAPIVFAVQLRRVQRALLVRELVESVPAAVTLIAAGVAGLRAAGAGAADRAIAVAEIASAGWMLHFLRRGVREVLGYRHAASAAPEGSSAPLLRPAHEEMAHVEWAGVAGAAMLGVEVLQHWRETGRVQRPTLLVAAFTLYLALGGRRMIARVMRRRVERRRPRLALSTEGIDYRGSRRRRFTVQWDDVTRVEHDAERLRVTLRDGAVREVRAGDHVDGHRLLAAVGAALPAYLPARLSGAPVNAP